MSKRKPPEPLESTPPDDENSPLKRFERLVSSALDRAESEQTDTSLRTAAIAVAEHRKMKAAEAKQLDDFNHDSVVAWARRITPELRAALVRKLQSLDSKRSGLA